MKSKLQKLKKALQERKLFPGEKYYGLGNKLPLKDKGDGVGPNTSEICKGVWKISTQPVESETSGVVFKHPLGNCAAGPKAAVFSQRDPEKVQGKVKSKPTPINKIRQLAKQAARRN